jgi:putative transcriptional regulator
MENSNLGNDILASLAEVQNHLAKKIELTSRIIKVPEAPDIKKIRKRFGYTQKDFALNFGFTLKAVQEWEQGRRNPERSARILLNIIDKDPSVVTRALQDFT